MYRLLHATAGAFQNDQDFGSFYDQDGSVNMSNYSDDVVLKIHQRLLEAVDNDVQEYWIDQYFYTGGAQVSAYTDLQVGILVVATQLFLCPASYVDPLSLDMGHLTFPCIHPSCNYIYILTCIHLFLLTFLSFMLSSPPAPTLFPF